MIGPARDPGLREQATGSGGDAPDWAPRAAANSRAAARETHRNPLGGPLPLPDCELRQLRFGGRDLHAVRREVSGWAASQGLHGQAADELVLAVNELASNSIRYGGGGGTLLMWREQDALVCEVRDQGRLSDPLAGLIRPEIDEPSGRGLWIVNQLCDLVQIRSSTSAGTRVRVHKQTDRLRV